MDPGPGRRTNAAGLRSSGLGGTSTRLTACIRKQPQPVSGPVASLPADEADFHTAIHAAYIEVQKAKIDRANAAATFVTTAAGTIGTIYTGLLALAFSVGSTPARPLPARGLAPGVFLALALFFSVVRVGFMRRSGQWGHIIQPATTWQEQERRLLFFMNWIDRGALARAWALRVAIVCLGAAVVLLPLPFLAMSGGAAVAAIVVVAVLVAAYVVYEGLTAHKPSPQAAGQQGKAR